MQIQHKTEWHRSYWVRIHQKSELNVQPTFISMVHGYVEMSFSPANVLQNG